jgi:glycosyltransferase involved in cell wall biosynthesis
VNVLEQNPLRVGLLLPRLAEDDGIGVYASRLIGTLKKTGLNLKSIAACDCPETEFVENRHRILPQVNPRELRFHQKLLAQRSEVSHLLSDCDVIHCLSESYAPLAWCISAGRPYFVTVYGSYASAPQTENSLWKSFYQKAFVASSSLLPISEFTRQALHKGVPEARTTVIPPALVKADLLIETEIPRDENVILCVAALKRRKGQDILVRTVKKLLPKFPTLRLVLAGSTQFAPDYLQIVKSEIERLQLESHVQIAGHVDEVELRNLYRSATVFALPSVQDDWRFEGYGLVLLEAAAAGLPLVGIRNTVAQEIIQHEQTGLLVDQTQIEDGFASAISRLLESKELRCTYGKAARENVKTRSWNCVAKDHISIYSSSTA